MMSTFNGEKFVSQQINSILAQEDVDIYLTIRDDGSEDNTVSILNNYNLLDNVNVLFGTNIGWKSSFTVLMHQKNLNHADYFAFSDQDDIWLSKKLISAINKIKYLNKPGVYISNATIVDSELKIVGMKFSNKIKQSNSYEKDFLNGYAIGATMVYNLLMFDLIQEYYPKIATNHDALVHALGLFFGKVLYDSKSYILYRRHANTVTGFGRDANSVKESIFDRYKKYKKNPKNQFSNRAKVILSGYDDNLRVDHRKFLSSLIEYKKSRRDKFMLLFSPKISCSSCIKTLQIKFRVFMNTL